MSHRWYGLSARRLQADYAQHDAFAAVDSCIRELAHPAVAFNETGSVA